MEQFSKKKKNHIQIPHYILKCSQSTKCLVFNVNSMVCTGIYILILLTALALCMLKSSLPHFKKQHIQVYHIISTSVGTSIPVCMAVVLNECLGWSFNCSLVPKMPVKLEWVRLFSHSQELNIFSCGISLFLGVDPNS